MSEDGDRGVRGWGQVCQRMGTGVLEDGEGGSVLGDGDRCVRGWGQGC